MPDATSGKFSLSELNTLSVADFVKVVGPIFEHSPWIAASAAHRRPFADWAALLETMRGIVAVSRPGQQLALIEAHPDLAGRLAQLGELTAESTREQKAAGLTNVDAVTLRKLQSLNEAYKTRFGFPCIICARLNNVTSILAAMETRLAQPRHEEISTSLQEIGKIAELRLRDLVK